MALTDNLSAYYKLDEASSTLFDSTANSLDSTTETGIIYGATGIINDAIDLQAGTDEVIFVDNAALNFGTGAFSINIWIDIDAGGASGGAGIITKHKESTAFNGWTLRMNGPTGVVIPTIGGGTIITGTTDVQGNGFTMVTWTRAAGGDNKLYINGVQEGSTVNNTTDVDFAIAMKMGRVNGFGSSMNGRLDECGIWKGKELSAAEVTELYNSGSGLTFPFITGINETDTTTITDSLTIARSAKTVALGLDDTTTLSDSLTIARANKTVSLSLSDTTNLSDSLILEITDLGLTNTTTLSDDLTIKSSAKQVKTLLTIESTEYTDVKSIVVDKTISDYNTTGSFKIVFDNPFGRHNDTFSLNEDVLIKANITNGTPVTSIIRGIIEDIDFQGSGTSGKLTLSGRDYGAILQDIIAEPRIFKDTEASQIVKSLMMQNVSDLTINNVDVTSTIIDKITFNGVSIFNAIKRVAELSGFFFFVDENLDLNFKENSVISSGLTFDNTNTQSATFRQSDDDIFNKVKVVGDRQLTAAQQIFETGVDNTGSVYELDAKPFNTKVTLSGTPNVILQPGGIININDPQTDNVKYLVNFQDSRIVLTSGTTAGDNIQPTGSVVIVDYDQSTPLIRFGQDNTSINAFGLKQKEIIDKNIKDLNEASDIASSFIAENKDPKTQGTVKVKDVVNIIPGNTAVVNLPTQGQDNVTYSILRAKYTFNPLNNLSKNVLDVTLSKKVNNFIDLFTQHELRLRALETSEVESSITNVEVFTGSIGVSGTSTITSRDIGSGFFFNVTGHDILNSNTSLLGDVRGGSTVQVL